MNNSSCLIIEQTLFKADTSFSYADTGIGNLGTGTLYLAAELTEIVDEEQPVEDCTAQPVYRERKNLSSKPPILMVWKNC